MGLLYLLFFLVTNIYFMGSYVVPCYRELFWARKLPKFKKKIESLGMSYFPEPNLLPACANLPLLGGTI